MKTDEARNVKLPMREGLCWLRRFGSCAHEATLARAHSFPVVALKAKAVNRSALHRTPRPFATDGTPSVALTSSLSGSAEIVAGRANFPTCICLFLSPRRRSGERTEERGNPKNQRASSPRPSPPSDGGEGVVVCGSAALRFIAGFQPTRCRTIPTHLEISTPSRLEVGDTAGWQLAPRVQASPSSNCSSSSPSS